MKPEEIKRRVDKIDLELLALLEERLGLALRGRELGEGEGEPGPVGAEPVPATRLSLNLVQKEFSEAVLRQIAAESRRLQGEHRKLVAFQGEHGAYSELAARRLVPGGAYVPCREFLEVFEGVERGDFDLGVVPVENSLEGVVTGVNQLLVTTPLTVIAEARVAVHHCLLAVPGTDYRELRMVYSHPQALAQCRGFLSRNKLEPRPFYDTAGAARMLARENPSAAAAIASRLSAELFGLEVLKESIDDGPFNATRFLLLRRGGERVEGNKCSIIFAVAHEAGRLHRVIQLFAEADINLSRIASMPLRSELGNYVFFLDLEGSAEDPRVERVLAELRERTISYKFLGCYPADTAELV